MCIRDRPPAAQRGGADGLRGAGLRAVLKADKVQGRCTANQSTIKECTKRCFSGGQTQPGKRLFCVVMAVCMCVLTKLYSKVTVSFLFFDADPEGNGTANETPAAASAHTDREQCFRKRSGGCSAHKKLSALMN